MLDDDGGSTEEIGYYETTLGNIMGSRNQTLTVDLKHDSSEGKKRGQIIVRAEAVTESNHKVAYQMSATDLDNNTGGCPNNTRLAAPTTTGVLGKYAPYMMCTAADTTFGAQRAT